MVQWVGHMIRAAEAKCESLSFVFTGPLNANHSQARSHPRFANTNQSHSSIVLWYYFSDPPPIRKVVLSYYLMRAAPVLILGKCKISDLPRLRVRARV
jgi:hypothetical protein